MSEIVLAFTGHRPNKLYGYDLLNEDNLKIRLSIRKVLMEYLNKYDSVIVYSGMALGIDQMVALETLGLRRNYYNIKLYCAIPFSGQEKAWFNPLDIDRFIKVLGHADKVINVEQMQDYVSPTINTKLQKRNEYMVDKCNVLIGYWDGTDGGTKNCINYAKLVNKELRIINPKEIE